MKGSEMAPRGLLFILALLTLASGQASARSASPYAISCPTAQVPVVVDGKWTSRGEWADASRTPLLRDVGYGTAYFLAKHDGAHLYAMIDFPSDHAMTGSDAGWIGDEGLLCFDPLNDGGERPKADDLAIHFFFGSNGLEASILRGNGIEWIRGNTSGPIEAAASTDAANDPYSGSPHVIYEFKIPLGIVANGTAVGFFISVADSELSNKMYWPRSLHKSVASRLMPDEWGILELSRSPIPEFGSPIPDGPHIGDRLPEQGDEGPRQWDGAEAAPIIR